MISFLLLFSSLLFSSLFFPPLPFPSLLFSSQILFSDSSHLCFSMCLYCRKFDFETSFDFLKYIYVYNVHHLEVWFCLGVSFAQSGLLHLRQYLDNSPLATAQLWVVCSWDARLADSGCRVVMNWGKVWYDWSEHGRHIRFRFSFHLPTARVLWILRVLWVLWLQGRMPPMWWTSGAWIRPWETKSNRSMPRFPMVSPHLRLQSPQGKNQPLVESEPPLKIEHGSQKLQFAVKKNILEPRAQFFLAVYLSMYISWSRL